MLAKVLRIAPMVCILTIATAHAAAAEKRKIQIGSTLDNLQTAYAGEMNAHTRYLAFADKAQQDGYGQVASLFRALAASEQIHANNHAAAIRGLNGTPQEAPEEPKVQSTKENLRFVTDGERWERSYLYPAYTKKARAEGHEQAATSFAWANISEAGHAVLCTEALNHLENMKEGSGTWQVCQVCGFVEKSVTTDKCSACSSPKDKYVPVS